MLILRLHPKPRLFLFQNFILLVHGWLSFFQKEDYLFCSSSASSSFLWSNSWLVFLLFELEESLFARLSWIKWISFKIFWRESSNNFGSVSSKKKLFFSKIWSVFSLTLSFYFLKCEIKDVSIQRYHERKRVLFKTLFLKGTVLGTPKQKCMQCTFWGLCTQSRCLPVTFS